MNSALIATVCRRARVAHLPCLWIVVACGASLMGAGCSWLPATEGTNEVAEPVEVAEPAEAPAPTVEAPTEPAAPPVTVQKSPDIVPGSTALFFGEKESQKTLTIHNQGNGAGEFSLLVPEETFTTQAESVSFTPASGTLAAGETATVNVEVQRDSNACTQVLRLAMLKTAQGSRNISVNYANVGKADLQIDRTPARARDFQSGGNIIDFGKDRDRRAEFTVTNRGCRTGTLTILKSGLHEEKLDIPGGPFTVKSGEPKVISLQRPDEKFFFGTRSVTLLIRQDNATVDNVIVRWAGL